MRARIEVVLGDIADEGVDAIVTAADESLMGGGGVDGNGGPVALGDAGRLGSRQPARQMVPPAAEGVEASHDRRTTFDQHFYCRGGGI